MYKYRLALNVLYVLCLLLSTCAYFFTILIAVVCGGYPCLLSVHVLLYYPVRACAARGRVIVLSVSRFVCLFVCLSAPTQDFEQNRLVYGLYLLRMSQKLKNINLYLPHERERTSGSREKQTFHIFWALLKLPFKIGDLFTTTIITIAQVNCNQAIVLAYALNFTC